MTKGVYFRTKKTRKTIGKASKGRHTLAWHIRKYGKNIGEEKYKQWCELRRNIAKGRKSAIKGKTWEEFYGIEKATKLIKKNRNSHLGKKQSEETKTRRSKSSIGRIHSEDSKKKMSITRKKKFKNGTLTLSPLCGCGKGGFKEDIGHYVRSSYEHNFARFLKQLNIFYKYEPRRFTVIVDGEQSTYMPDFNIKNIWFEIKNSYNVKDKIFNKKLKSFKKLYKKEKIYIVIGNSKDIKTWVVKEEQKDLVDILYKLEPLAVIKG